MAINFSWVVPERVAGMAMPAAEHVPWLQRQGVTAVVSLSEAPPRGLDPLDVFHVPVQDMTSPTLDQLHALVEHMQGVVARGGRVAVHCAAGMGRTGTVLAAYLVSEGLPAREAIVRVRALRPGSIETRSQELAIVRYAELTGGART